MVSLAGKYFPKEFLSGYKGYLQCDGYESYESAVKGRSEIELVGCFAHVRRKYYKAWVTSKKRSPEAKRGLEYVQSICAIEAELRGMGLADKLFVERDMSSKLCLNERIISEPPCE